MHLGIPGGNKTGHCRDRPLPGQASAVPQIYFISFSKHFCRSFDQLGNDPQCVWIHRRQHTIVSAAFAAAAASAAAHFAGAIEDNRRL